MIKSKNISVELVIIGAGTAGISAYKEASKFSDKVLLIDHGPLGTTCARVGCMPSKSLIQVSNYFHDRVHFSECGIKGANQLKVDISTTMRHVRKLRDSFTSGIINYLESLGNKFIQGKAEFIDTNVIKVNNRIIVAKSVIIATGTSPFIPPEWREFSNLILTTDNIFEQTNFPENMAVIGGGPVGLELGQALSRLGIEVELFHSHEFIAGLSDPIVNDHALKILREEFPIYLGPRASIEKNKKRLLVKCNKNSYSAAKVLAALGRKPNVHDLNLEELGVEANKVIINSRNRSILKIKDFPFYVAGDVGKFLPILHEAADDGLISGYNAVRKKPYCFKRRTPLIIIFTEPNIALVGKSYKELKNVNFVVGEVHFNNQGRSRIMLKNKGILRIYADSVNGKLLGAEMIAPEGEHLAHLLAWVIQNNMTVFEILQMPFYHPVVEEGLRTALRNAARQVRHKNANKLDLIMCDSEDIH